MPKFVFFTGGVSSSIGKGVAAATLGAVLEASKLKVAIAKLDPYINVDPGTMNPLQHGEVFVTEDGAETDLDLGHYERFLKFKTSKRSNCTTGQIYERVIRREREGGYLGTTVQVIPHITDEIKDFIHAAAGDADVAIIEIGGTVGDIESLPFLEAIRQLQFELPRTDTCSVHMTLVPYLASAGELKTKPTQHSVRDLREIGIQVDCLLCRSSRKLPTGHRKKISQFSSIDAEKVFTVPDVDLIYSLPLRFAEDGIDKAVCSKLGIEQREPALSSWSGFVDLASKANGGVTIGFVGKYVNPKESYKSLIEALIHAGYHTGHQVRLSHLDLDDLAAGNAQEELAACDALLVPGAFGDRGIEGKIAAIRHAREAGKPYLGICIGMQLALVEFARSKLNWEDANSTEFNPDSSHPVVCLENGGENRAKRDDNGNFGGTMRLGAYECELKAGSKMRSIYGVDKISERHRHRYEFNNKFREPLEEAGLVFSAWSGGGYCEAIELEDHPFFVATQFHPEYKSTPMDSHPLFKDFITAAAK